jgi:D-glycero-alpha-D-manno-heptose-7-phosphate kinase
MILVRAPFRIPLGGGGTDLPSYYSRFGGELISMAIDKYVYININRPPVDNLIRLKYSESETVNSLNDIRHELIREALRATNVKNKIEISSMADAPSGTGLGSSGAFLVALLKGLHTLKNESITTQELAEEACKIEMLRLKKPVGKQDQYLAAFGGITHMQISPAGIVKVSRIPLDEIIIRSLEENILVFYTGIRRKAEDILKHQNKSVSANKKAIVSNMHNIKKIGQEITRSVKKGDLQTIGKLLNEHWVSKRSLSKSISNPIIDQWYESAISAGALGGKLMGAGGGGFFMFCCPGNKTQLRTAMKKHGLVEVFFRIDREGSKVIANF